MADIFPNSVAHKSPWVRFGVAEIEQISLDEHLTLRALQEMIFFLKRYSNKTKDD